MQPVKPFFILLVLFLSGIIAILVVLSRKGKHDGQEGLSEAPPPGSIRSSAPPPQRGRFATATDQREEIEPWMNLLDEPSYDRLSPHAQRILKQAVVCAAFIELEKRKYPVNENVFRILDGAQRRLFLDDYLYGAHVSSSINQANAEKALRYLRDRLQDWDEETIHNSFGGSLEQFGANLPGADRADTGLKGGHDSLSKHYATLRASTHDPSYSNVYATISLYAPKDPASTDLFKDALVYAAVNTQYQNWIEQEKQFMRQSIEDFREMDPNADIIARLEAKLDSNINAGIKEFVQLLDAYHKIFTLRFSEYHGITDPSALADLSKVSVPTPSPRDLSIPPPD